MIKETWWSIFTDPHHIIAELAWTLIQDVIFGFVLYKMVWKKVIYPKLHAKFDIDHGLNHIKYPTHNISVRDIEKLQGIGWDDGSNYEVYINNDVDYHGGWGKKKDW